MPGCELYVKIDEPFQGQVAEEWIRRVVEKTLIQEEINSPVELGLVITDDETIRQLNRSYRGKDETTDVLSFENQTRGPYSIGTAGFPRYLGDVVISLDRAREQADAAGGALIDELQLLAVHGVLHLLGYDHADEREKEQMWAIQSGILRMLDVNIRLPE